jgi:hypothetical protein
MAILSVWQPQEHVKLIRWGKAMTQAAQAFEDVIHGLMNYTDTNAKCRHLKKFIFKRDFAAGVYRSNTPHPFPPFTQYTYMYLLISYHTERGGGEENQREG